MNDKSFEILQLAVRLARDEQIRTVPVLRSRLLQHYPGEDVLVAEALAAWAGYVRKAGVS